MHILSSCFHRSGKHPGAVAIANSTRFYPHVPKYKPLVPPWALVKDSRAGRIDAATFRRRYQAQLDALDARQVFADIRALIPGEEAVLLCWEADPSACHRRQAAAWLERELGIEVREWRP